MANLIDSLVLGVDTDLPDPGDMENRVLNEISGFIDRNHQAPKYLYINDRTWALCFGNIITWTDPLGIEVIDNKFQHPRCVFVKGQRYAYRDIAAESARLMEDEEGSIMSGLLEIL